MTGQSQLQLKNRIKIAERRDSLYFHGQQQSYLCTNTRQAAHPPETRSANFVIKPIASKE
jgi:hypothetical protein